MQLWLAFSLLADAVAVAAQGLMSQAVAQGSCDRGEGTRALAFGLQESSPLPNAGESVRPHRTSVPLLCFSRAGAPEHPH